MNTCKHYSLWSSVLGSGEGKTAFERKMMNLILDVLKLRCMLDIFKLRQEICNGIIMELFSVNKWQNQDEEEREEGKWSLREISFATCSVLLWTLNFTTEAADEATASVSGSEDRSWKSSAHILIQIQKVGEVFWGECLGRQFSTSNVHWSHQWGLYIMMVPGVYPRKLTGGHWGGTE